MHVRYSENCLWSYSLSRPITFIKAFLISKRIETLLELHSWIEWLLAVLQLIWSLWILAFTNETPYDTVHKMETGPGDTKSDENKQNITSVNGPCGSSVTDSDQSVNIK